MVWEYKLPTEYRDFFIRFNGGLPEKSYFLIKDNPQDASRIKFFFSVCSDPYMNLLKTLKTYQNRIPHNMHPVGKDPFGNLILISVKGADRGKVYFWDHEMEIAEGKTPDYSNLTVIANNFWSFLKDLKYDLAP